MGCGVVCSAICGRADSQLEHRLHSVPLLAAGLTANAFEAGQLSERITDFVAGPIVVTMSNSDKASNDTYKRVGSGAGTCMGADGAESVRYKVQGMVASPRAYTQLECGQLNNIDASRFVRVERTLNPLTLATYAIVGSHLSINNDGVCHLIASAAIVAAKQLTPKELVVPPNTTGDV